MTINKSEKVLEFIRDSHLFKSFCENLPSDAQPKDMQIKVTYKPKSSEEQI